MEKTAAHKPADTDEARKAELVIASHLLVDREVLDSFGHISVRSASNPKTFFMPRAMPPALVQLEDIIAISVETGERIDPHAPRPNGERYIHSETYKARPDVECVIHSHAMAVLPFGVAGVPLQPVIAQAGFLPPQTPVFEIRDAWGPAAEKRGVQVRSREHAAALAKVLGAAPAVILRGHGHDIVGDSIRRAVVRAVYININATVQMDALRLGAGKIIPLDQKEIDYNEIENFDVDRPWDNFVRIMKEKDAGRR
ncbi:MAG: class II aldolase/adducin family protein [Deltaproteobacteria bacterium]|nr:class II aldolase/adducin family protein [Deltaproteobacteria bacterium]